MEVDVPKLTPRQQVAAVREARRKERFDKPTFKPNLVSSHATAGESTTSSSSSRFDRLYYDAKQRQEKEKQSPSLSESEFKPKITARGRAMSRERNADTPLSEPRARKTEQPIVSTPVITKRASSIDRAGNIGDRLYSTAAVSAAKKEKAKQDVAKRLSSDCTFAPKMAVGKSRSSSASRLSVTPAEVVARQQKYEESRAKRRAELVSAKEQRDVAELKFKPTLAAQSVNDSLLPQTAEDNATTVFDRLQKTVVKDLTELQEQLDAELTFKPKVVPYAHSNKGENAPSKDKDVHSKLYKEGITKAQQRQEEAEKRQAEELAKLTFHPSLPAPPNPALSMSNLSVHTHSMSPEKATAAAGGSETGTARTSSTVFDRLTLSNKSHTADMLLQIKTSLELEQCTFKPSIPASSHCEDISSMDDIFTRLQRDAAVVREKAERKEAEKVYQQLRGASFKPHIPEASRELASKKTSSGLAASGPSSAAVKKDSSTFPAPHPM